ncbi:Auxilin-like protein 1 [Nymphaea thermarum]|nr:Auxilin-like protein 1 [Nymphaea thermarum]
MYRTSHTAKALAEMKARDILVEKEQAERNRLAEVLDCDIKRWSNGKEGNLRALLSTLQYEAWNNFNSEER